MKTITYTNDELHAFSEHVTWCIYEQDQPVDDDLESFIHKTLYDNQTKTVDINYNECVDTLLDSMNNA
tara:strand:- start:1104 stop:1307 length:204 start_codon:yes stop_codon:yes gene_type:complete